MTGPILPLVRLKAGIAIPQEHPIRKLLTGLVQLIVPINPQTVVLQIQEPEILMKGQTIILTGIIHPVIVNRIQIAGPIIIQVVLITDHPVQQIITEATHQEVVPAQIAATGHQAAQAHAAAVIQGHQAVQAHAAVATLDHLAAQAQAIAGAQVQAVVHVAAAIAEVPAGLHQVAVAQEVAVAVVHPGAVVVEEDNF